MKQIGLLAVLFVVLLVAVVVKEASRPTAGDLRDEVPLVPVAARPFDAADVQRIAVTGADGSALFHIARENDVWVLAEPFRAPAAAGAVLRLVEALAGARGELRLDDGAALSKFDLADGQAPGVEVFGADGASLAHVAVGKSSGTDGCFVRLLHDAAEADRSYAVNADLRGALGLPRSLPGSKPSDDPEASFFHDKNIPTLKVAAADRLTLATPSRTVVLARGEDDAWEVAAGGPGDLPVKQDGVQRLLRQLLSGMSASGLADPARRSELGFDSPGYRVTATLPDGAERTLLGVTDEEAQQFHARLDVEQDPDVVYEIAPHQWSLLFPPGSGLFEFPRLSPAEPERAVIEIRSDQGVVRMVREPDSSWRVVEPAWGLRPRDAALRSLTGILPNLQPVDWVDAAVLPDIGEPSITLAYGPRAALAQPDALTQVVIGGRSPAGRDRVARLPNMPGRIVVLADATVDRLTPELLDLFDAALLPDWVDVDVVRASVRPLAGDGAALEVERGADGSWALRSGDAEEAADADAVADWLAALVDAQVASVEVAPGEPTHALILQAEDGERVALGLRADGDAGYVVFLGSVERPSLQNAFRVAGQGLLPEVEQLKVSVPEDDGNGDGDGDGSDEGGD